MPSKSLLIAIAAFAVTATGAQAFVGSNYLNQTNLSIEQVEAFNQARELRKAGEVEKARDLLVEAGVDEDVISELRKAAHAAHAAIHEAVEAGDFEAFKKAAEGTPLYDIINSEADFALFKQAHDLKSEGKFAESKAILDELGVVPPKMGEGRGHVRHHEFLAELTFEQIEALRVAKQANDEDTVKAILKEAGIDEAKIEQKMEKRNWR